MALAGKWMAEQSRAEKDKVQPLAAEQLGVGGGTDIRERQGQKHNQSQEHSPWTPLTSLYSHCETIQNTVSAALVLIVAQLDHLCLHIYMVFYGDHLHWIILTG